MQSLQGPMRYAIYYVPPEDNPLTRAASAWLGRDAFRDTLLDQPDTADTFDATELQALTADPRRYGFHATLKAPFELAEGQSEEALVDAVQAFAAERKAFGLTSIVLGQLGPFFALVPGAPSEELQNLADDCVRRFEPFRAPLTEQDYSRRNPVALSERQRHYLRTWGYPYVFDEFRFHMTLSGQVPDEVRPAMRRVLEGRFSSFLDRPLAIGHVALFSEPQRGAPFGVRLIAPLGNSPDRKDISK